MKLIDADKLKEAINSSLNTGRETFSPDKMKLTGVYGREYFQSNGKMPSYKIGWNDCIDAITGGNSDD